MTDQVFWEERANYEEAWANIWPKDGARVIQSKEEFDELVGPDRPAMQYKPGETYEALEYAVEAHDRAAIAQGLKDRGVSAPMAEFGSRALSYMTTPTGAAVTAAGVGVGIAMAPLYGTAAAAAEGYATIWALGKVALAETAISTSISAAVNYVEAEHSRRKEFGATEVAIEGGLGLLFGFLPARAAWKGAKRDIAEANAKALQAELEAAAQAAADEEATIIRELANTIRADGWDVTDADVKTYAEVRQSFENSMDLVREGAYHRASQRGTAEAGQRAVEDIKPTLDDNMFDAALPNAKDVVSGLASKGATPYDFSSEVDNILYRIGTGDEALLEEFTTRTMDKGLSNWSRESTRSRIRAAADLVTDRVHASGKVLDRGELPDPASFNLTKAVSKPVSVEGVDLTFSDNLSRLLYLAKQGPASAKRGARKMLEDAGLNPVTLDALGQKVVDTVADQVRDLRAQLPKTNLEVQATLKDVDEVVAVLGKSGKVRSNEQALKKMRAIEKAAKHIESKVDITDVFSVKIKDRTLRALYAVSRGSKEVRAIARSALKEGGLTATEIKNLSALAVSKVDANINPKAVKELGKGLSAKVGLGAEELQKAMPERLPVKMKMGRVDGEHALVDVMAELDSSNFKAVTKPRRASTDAGDLTREGRTPQAAHRESDASDVIIEELPSKYKAPAKAAAEEAQKKGDELLKIAASKECSLA
jgi:hypothetical protein